MKPVTGPVSVYTTFGYINHSYVLNLDGLTLISYNGADNY